MISDLKASPGNGAVLELPHLDLGDDAIDLDFDMMVFNSMDSDFPLPKLEEPAGLDSGFSSPQDSPRHYSSISFDSFGLDHHGSRTRAFSTSSLGLDEAVSALMSTPDSYMESESDCFFDFHGLGPMADGSMFLKPGNLQLPTLMPLKEDPYAKDEFSHTTIQHTDSAVAPSVPGSPMGGINPGLLTQFEDDPDLEIDVVGDGDFVQSSPAALTREDSMSSSYTLSSNSSQDLAALAIESATTVLPAQLIPLHPNAAAIMHMNLPGLHSVAAMPSTPAGTPAPAASAAAMNGAMKSRAGPYPKRNSERKRHLHNELERKRREDLNQTFFRLGDLLPNFQNANTQPTQVHILQGAATYIHELKERHTQLLSTRATVQQEGQRLQERLRELQAMCAAN